MNPQARNVLLVEDSKLDVFLVREAIATHRIPVDLNVIEDGERAIDWIDHADSSGLSRPELILLDLNLPRRGGAEVLAHLKRRAGWEGGRVLGMTSSPPQADKTQNKVL